MPLSSKADDQETMMTTREALKVIVWFVYFICSRSTWHQYMLQPLNTEPNLYDTPSSSILLTSDMAAAAFLEL